MNITPKYQQLFRKLSYASTDAKHRDLARKGPLSLNFFNKGKEFDDIEFTKIVHDKKLVDKDIYQKDSFKSTGNCWSFAFCNLCNYLIMKKYNLSDFKLNPSYVLFWDKLEKANRFLHNIIKTRKEPLSKVNKYLRKPITDGGNYNYFINIVDKYGIIPMKDMKCSYHFYASQEMNELLSDRLREYAFILRNNPTFTKKQIKEMVIIFLAEVYRFLHITLGSPPKTIKFKLKQNDKLQTITPLTFYHQYVPVDVKDFICLTHNPCKSYYTKYKVENSTNMNNGLECNYYNLPMTEIQQLVQQSLDNDTPLYCACDIRPYHNPLYSVLDEKSFQYDKLLGFQDSLDKCPHLLYSKSEPNHAILLKGYDTNKQKQITKWLAEDSHQTGHKSIIRDHLVLSKSWFRKFVYKTVIHKQFFPKELQNKFGKVVKVCKKFF